MRLSDQEKLVKQFPELISPVLLFGTFGVKFKKDSRVVIDYYKFFTHKVKLERINDER